MERAAFGSAIVWSFNGQLPITLGDSPSENTDKPGIKLKGPFPLSIN
ncbi:hypothetical protein LEP1GSC125_2965 [Leptospira mayottensis 200901122]|uniref:Uncharacterized protein n=1 Tax=Leptospira mayottensis 200901122 TaxID=1193010 RepID=A0AA87SWB1_9LEPT|nr:hypothetical protein LEP1GSC125_2965 [Leptospira mayottensis 200901122]